MVDVSAEHVAYMRVTVLLQGARHCALCFSLEGSTNLMGNYLSVACLNVILR